MTHPITPAIYAVYWMLLEASWMSLDELQAREPDVAIADGVLQLMRAGLIDAMNNLYQLRWQFSDEQLAYCREIEHWSRDESKAA